LNSHSGYRRFCQAASAITLEQGDAWGKRDLQEAEIEATLPALNTAARTQAMYSLKDVQAFSQSERQG